MRQGCTATLYLRKNMSLIFGLLSNAYHQTQDIVDIRALIACNKKLHLTQPSRSRNSAKIKAKGIQKPTNCVSLYIQNIQKPQRYLNLQDESGGLHHRTCIYTPKKTLETPRLQDTQTPLRCTSSTSSWRQNHHYVQQTASGNGQFLTPKSSRSLDFSTATISWFWPNFSMRMEKVNPQKIFSTKWW